jgi:hypothetical protein
MSRFANGVLWKGSMINNVDKVQLNCVSHVIRLASIYNVICSNMLLS